MTRLGPFVSRVLEAETPAGKPDTLKLLLPLTTEPGVPFDATLVALRDNSVPTLECDWTATISCPAAGVEPIKFKFTPGQLAAARIQNIVIEQPGIYRFELACEGANVVSTPTVCRADHPFRVFWGDPHVHTILSNCHPEKCRSLPFAYFAGRYLSALDWMACADHVSNGRCALPQWREETAASNHHNDPGNFVALPAYEASLKGMHGGDNNIYMRRWPAYFVDHFAEGTVKTLLDELLADHLPPDDAFAVPHHTTRTGKHGEIPAEIYPGEKRMPVVEITSCWGNSEIRGNPDALKAVHEGPSYVVDLLNQGLPLGFVGGTDTHISMPFQFDNRAGNLHTDPGGTGVYAAELTRDAIFDAIRSRSCYAGKRERSYLNVTINGIQPGREAKMSTGGDGRTFAVEAAGPSPIETIDIIRNGQTIHAIPGTGWRQKATWTDGEELASLALAPDSGAAFVYYYVRVRYQDATLAWSSPVWFRA